MVLRRYIKPPRALIHHFLLHGWLYFRILLRLQILESPGASIMPHPIEADLADFSSARPQLPATTTTSSLSRLTRCPSSAPPPDLPQSTQGRAVSVETTPSRSNHRSVQELSALTPATRRSTIADGCLSSSFEPLQAMPALSLDCDHHLESSPPDWSRSVVRVPLPP